MRESGTVSGSFAERETAVNAPIVQSGNRCAAATLVQVFHNGLDGQLGLAATACNGTPAARDPG